MNKKLKSIMCLLIISTMILTGCLNAPSSLVEKKETNITDVPSIQTSNKVNNALFNFAWDMFKESAKDEGNIMISAPSIYIALASS